MPRSCNAQEAPGEKKLAPLLVLTVRSHRTLIGTTVTLLVSLPITVCVPPAPVAPTPLAVTMFMTLAQWLVVIMHVADEPVWPPGANVVGKPHPLKFNPLSSEMVKLFNATLPTLVTVIW